MVSVSRSVMPDSLQPHGLQPTTHLSMGFSKQGYWSGLPFPSPGDHPNPGIEPRSPALQADSLPTDLQGKPINTLLLAKVHGFHLGSFYVAHSVGFDKGIITYTHH